jgi:hypothetical protein
MDRLRTLASDITVTAFWQGEAEEFEHDASVTSAGAIAGTQPGRQPSISPATWGWRSSRPAVTSATVPART